MRSVPKRQRLNVTIRAWTHNCPRTSRLDYSQSVKPHILARGLKFGYILSINERYQKVTYNLIQDNILFIVKREFPILQHSFLWHRVSCITTMDTGVHHSRMHDTHSLTNAIMFILVKCNVFVLPNSLILN